QADTDDVVSRLEGLRSKRSNDRRADRSLGLAEIDVEVFDLRAPAIAQSAFDAAADGKSGLHILEGRDHRPHAGRGGRRVILDLTVGRTGRAIDQDIRSPQEAETAAGRTEPFELVVGREGRQRKDANEGRAALLTGGLKVG